MQIIYIKKHTFFLALFVIISFTAVCQNIKPLKAKADSLFESKKYLESFVFYDSILRNHKVAPDMLLKMAYVKEGLDDYTMALYYLNLYQLNYPNSLVLKKMETLGSRHHLIGYEFTDYEYFTSIYNRFSIQISYILLGISLMLFIYTGFMIYQGRGYSRIRLYLIFFILLFSYAFINFGIPSYKGIVNQNNTFIMDGPSSGAKVLASTGKGNRVNILGKDDVWYEVLWEGKPAFIKKNHLLTVVNSRNAEQFNLFSILYNHTKTIYQDIRKTIDRFNTPSE